MRSHKDLLVWKAAMDLAAAVYVSARAFPREEQFGLAAQLRGCSSSIPSNIAEGAARQGKKEFIQFLRYALGSAAELETQLELARRVRTLSQGEFDRLDADLFKVRQLLRGLIASVRKSKERLVDDWVARFRFSRREFLVTLCSSRRIRYEPLRASRDRYEAGGGLT